MKLPFTSHIQDEAVRANFEAVETDIEVFGFETGDFKVTSKKTAPEGWLMCLGQEVEGAAYPNLAALWGTGATSLYGAAAVGKIKLPDGRGRTYIGAGFMSGSEEIKLGAIGGKETVQLIINNMPAHAHGGSTGTGTTGTESATHTHTITGGPSAGGGAVGAQVENLSSSGPQGLISANSTSHTHSVPALSIASEGVSAPFNILNPSFTVNHLVKV